MNLNQVTVPSLDVAKAILFYKKLGLQLIVHSSPNYARFSCPDGSSTFSVHQVTEMAKGAGIWVYFENTALDLVVAQLIEKGIKFTEMPNDKPWLWKEAHLFDPDGNKIILFEAGKNRENPPWRINETFLCKK
ncbi:MAG: glyoxalase/bleomycin resistance/extradiol dioxygenase family protein [Flavobacteriaceae bacterium]|nr:MAG: glyoxalase/bleomycin resistance/extradiol dioxygenase family protein [Flavobacteriaceae bacterium]